MTGYSAGPVYPPPGPVPDGPWHVPAYLDPTDHLVPPPNSGFDAWYTRVVATVRRSWRPLLVVLGLTHVLPTLVLGGIVIMYVALVRPEALRQSGTEPFEGPDVAPFIGGLVFFAIVFILVVSLLQAIGYAAATWIVVREAAGEPAEPGEALRYGARRMMGLWGWTLLSSLIMAGGLCLCILPGIYFAFALSLIGPVYLFERRNPIGRSWGLVHANFGPVLGRVALITAVVLAAQVIISMLQNVVGLVLSAGSELSTTALAFTLAFTAVGVIVTLPATVVQVVGLIVTYVEQRAREAPLNTRGLLAALG
jgi:hypothetical protein